MMYRTALVIIITLFFLADTAAAGMSFIKKTRLVTRDGDNVVLQQKYYSEGDMLRVEEESSAIEGNPGIRIYDFSKKKLYTIMLNVKLYLEQDLSSERDVIMFEPVPEKKFAFGKDLKVEKIKKGKETIEGFEATIYEVKAIRKAEKGKGKEDQLIEKYLIWEVEALDDMPVRYEFELSGDSKKIIEYTDIKRGDLDPLLFSTPEGYMAISPF